jgi:uncharacterized protein YndB with AHSA1/START domain
VKIVEKRLYIEASPTRVYELLTRADLLVQWMAPIASVNPEPGGMITWTHESGDTVVGEFVVLVPARRIVFTFGWSREEVGIPAGDTTVEIELRPSGTGTDLHLVHRGLDGPMADAHAGGWDNYINRLATVAEGRDPGEDPLASERVPSARDLGSRSTTE